MAEANPLSEWGEYQAAALARYELKTEGGDPRPKGNGAASSPKFRRLELKEADEANVGNERTELGRNERRFGSAGGEGTFMVYPESTKTIETWFSLRLPESFPLSNENWQVVMQMKQAQPYVGDNEGHVILELEARQNQFQIITPWNSESSPLWTCTATKNRWIRFRLAVVYSKSSSKGSLKIQVDDREGASTWVPQYESALLPLQTLATSSGEGSGLKTNDPIPSHLRLGIYRNPVINTTTTIDIGNVQVYESNESPKVKERTNLLKRPDFESTFQFVGAGTGGSAAQSATHAHNGTKALLAKSTGGAVNAGAQEEWFTHKTAEELIGGSQVTFSFWVYIPSGSTLIGKKLGGNFGERNEAGTFLGNEGYNTPTLVEGWQQCSKTWTLRATTWGFVFSTTTLETLTCEWWVDSMMLEYSAETGEYFDGSVAPSGYTSAWVGTEHNSRSIATEIYTGPPIGSRSLLGVGR